VPLNLTKYWSSRAAFSLELVSSNKPIQKFQVLTLGFFGYFGVGEFTDDTFVFDDVFDGIEIESV